MSFICLFQCYFVIYLFPRPARHGVRVTRSPSGRVYEYLVAWPVLKSHKEHVLLFAGVAHLGREICCF